MSMKFQRAFDVSAMVIVFGILAYSNSFYPFGRDQGNYALAAWEYLNGRSLYSEVLAFKPPMTVWLHALAQIFGGHSMEAIRWVDGLIHLVSGVSIYAIVVMVTSNRFAGLVSGTSLGAFYWAFDDWHGAQTDVWLNAPILVTLALLQWRKVDSTWILAGVSIGLCFWLKFTYLFAFVVFLPFMGRSFQRPLALMGIGFFGISVAVMFLLGSSSLSAFYQHVTEELPGYASHRGGLTNSGFLMTLRQQPTLQPLGIGLLFALALTTIKIRTEGWRTATDPLGMTVLMLATVGIVSCVSQGKYFIYHFGSMLAPTALWLGWTVGNSRLRLIVPLACVLLLSGIFFPVYITREKLFLMQHPSLKREFWTSPRFDRPDFSFREQLEMAQWLQRNTPSDSTVFVWGFDPSINFLSERHNPTRFIYNFPFRQSNRHLDILHLELANTAPRYFIVASRDATPWVSNYPYDSARLLKETPGLSAWLTQHYEEVERIGRYNVWQWRRP